MEFKVITVKNNGDELERALNQEWTIVRVAANNNGFVYTLQRHKKVPLNGQARR